VASRIPIFDARRLSGRRIDLALEDRLGQAGSSEIFSVLIELRHDAPLDAVRELALTARPVVPGLFEARLSGGQIRALDKPAVHRVWLNHTVRALTTRSMAAIKADAALSAFNASGRGIVWAVADSGIALHSHFDACANLILPEGVLHRDFTGGDSPLSDEFGHGTHVAGILAGRSAVCNGPRGAAPDAKLVSLKVLGPDGCGAVSDIIAALAWIQQVNDHGRRHVIDGVNLSLGYDFDPEWYACGASPLCREVDRLVQSGVVVVVAAGNSGYGYQNSLNGGAVRACLDLSINDPGNAALAITVGSTHRDMPHTYGVSYFSSKGPTGDGRMKPDLLAPGERIVGPAAPSRAPAGEDWRTAYIEDSGTSMAAPHVSGAIAAFLSVRGEFRGRPQAVKEIFLESATDLGRVPSFQGRGLVNLFEALQRR